MFTKQELFVIRKALDAFYDDKTPEKEHHLVMSIRDKCTDLIILKTNWNKKQNLCDIL
jgi:hypothetical protein